MSDSTETPIEPTCTGTTHVGGVHETCKCGAMFFPRTGMPYLLRPELAPATAAPTPAPVPMILHCPECGTRHVDTGEFATKPHHTHACQSCGLVWRPAIVPTVGVQFLPGFRDGAPAEVSGSAQAHLHDTMDAAVWAREFCRLNPAIDEGLMLGWFANAIMAGYDEGMRRAESVRTAAEALQAELDRCLADSIYDKERKALRDALVETE